MHHAAVQAGTRNRREGLLLCAEPSAGVLKVRLHLVLHHPGLQVLHDELQALARDIYGFADPFDFVRIFDLPKRRDGRMEVF